jgi:gluconate 2-dehydrogenase gamma chain
MPSLRRRQWLAASALVGVGAPADAHSIRETSPWSPNEVYPPQPAGNGPWQFFTPEEAAAVEAIADRLIPADEKGAGGKDAGCAVFIDRQLAGGYGVHEGLYMQGPFPPNPLPSQGLQSPVVPREQYRRGLAALDQHCKQNFGGKPFAQLTPQQQDQLLTGLEKDEVKLQGYSGRALFEAVLNNVMEGYFADPVYGGNKDMVGWKLVGFPGTRYDYRDVMKNPNQPYTLPPVSIHGRPDWNRSSK